MGYLERLREYLERVERASDGAPVIRIDHAAHMQHFLKEGDQSGGVWDAERADVLRRNLRPFVDLVAYRILDRIAPGASSDDVVALINTAISLGLGVPRSAGSKVLDEELERLAGEVYSDLGSSVAFDQWEFPDRYAAEVRAVRRRGDRYFITRAGAVFINLSGMDAVRWLLTLEAAQSLGPADVWRISPELAARLLKNPRNAIRLEDLCEHDTWSSSFPTIRRLGAMSLLRYEFNESNPHTGNPCWFYSVFDRSRSVLEEIAEGRATPFALLADALLRDDVTGTLEALRPAADRVQYESVAAATALQARMVVHEIRNALVPARSAFLSLVEELDESTRTESLQRYQRRIHEGINQALSFSENMLRVANLGIEPVAPFDLVVAIKEAIAAVAWELNGSLRYSPPEGVLQVVGPQARFIMAIANLLRNAAQAIAGREGVVEVSVEATAGRVVLRIDDDGPGVPVEQRRMIFEQGVTLRSGGSGQGLALVRQVIEGEMRGTVSCGDSPLGGARFEIVIPVVEE